MQLQRYFYLKDNSVCQFGCLMSIRIDLGSVFIFPCLSAWLTLLFCFSSNPQNNTLIWLRLQTWYVVGHLTYPIPIVDPKLFQLWQLQIQISMLWKTSIASSLSCCPLFLLFLCTSLRMHTLLLSLCFSTILILSCFTKPGLSLTSFSKAYLMNSKWLLAHVSLELSTQVLLC